MAKPGQADNVFLLNAINQNLSYLHRRSQGSTFLAVGSNDLLTMPVAAPDLPLQQCIAEILSTVDEAIEQTETLIAKTQQIKAGLMHDLFTQGVTKDGRLRPPREEAPQLYKQSPLGWIPREWDEDLFGSSVSIIDPNPSHRYPEEQEEGIPICSTENFRGEDEFDFARSKLMPPSVFMAQQQRCHFNAIDVVFARKGRIGLARRYGITPKVFSHTVVLFKARTHRIYQPWLMWLARSHWFLDDIDRRMNSNSGVPTLGVAFINAVSVPFPEVSEQRLINEQLDGISERIASEETHLHKLQQLKVGLMNDLLTGLVRVPVAETAEPKEVAADV